MYNMPKDTIVKVQEYKDSLIQKAETLITIGCPEKIIKLNQLLSTPMFNERYFSEVHQDVNIWVLAPILINHHLDLRDENDNVSGTIVLGLPSNTIPCIKPVCDVIKVVKPIILQLVKDSNLLKMWIRFMIPKIEAGNNFSVSIQKDTLAEFQYFESQATACFDQISRYFLARANMVSKVAKYPYIDDYRRAVVELDELAYFCLRQLVSGIRNRYTTLHDMVIKNLDKLKNPRSSNTESLY